MKRLAIIGGLLLAIIAIGPRAASVSIDVPIDPARLNLSPAEKAAYCGTTAPTCPEVPVVPPAIPPSIPPPGTWSGVCPGFSKTLRIPMSWAAPTRMYTKDFGFFGPADILVVELRTGNNPTSPGNLPRISAAEYNASPSTRVAALSETPCEFVGVGMGSTTSSQSVQFVFSIETAGGFFVPTLKKNTPYYLNVKNADGATCSTSGVCDMFVDLVKPGGL